MLDKSFPISHGELVYLLVTYSFKVLKPFVTTSTIFVETKPPKFPTGGNCL